MCVLLCRGSTHREWVGDYGHLRAEVQSAASEWGRPACVGSPSDLGAGSEAGQSIGGASDGRIDFDAMFAQTLCA